MSTISIVIPTKNEEYFLPSLLESIKKQTRQPEELIIADAMSIDKTREIALAYGAQIIDGGLPGPGRNIGAAFAKSDVVLFLDADVVLPEEDFLAKAMHEFDERHLDIASPDVSVIEGKPYDKVTHEIYNVYARLWGSVHPHAPGFCIFVRKSLHDAIGGFDPTVLFCEDHEYAHRAAKKGSFGFLNSVRVAVTTRRQERDGRMAMAMKYMLAELHILFLGPIRHNKFKYGFGYTTDIVKKVKKEKYTE